MSSAHCDFCDLPLDQCEHGARTKTRFKAQSVGMLEVSPAHMAHYPGCPHKGDDSDRKGWGEIRHAPDSAWQQLGNRQPVTSDAGARPGLVAAQRCSTCDEHGPWR